MFVRSSCSQVSRGTGTCLQRHQDRHIVFMIPTLMFLTKQSMEKIQNKWKPIFGIPLLKFKKFHLDPKNSDLFNRAVLLCFTFTVRNITIHIVTLWCFQIKNLKILCERQNQMHGQSDVKAGQLKLILAGFTQWRFTTRHHDLNCVCNTWWISKSDDL